MLRFFRWFCHPDYLEDIEGDLLEMFDRKVSQFGAKKARLLFFWDILRLFRPGIIRSLHHNPQIIHFSMIKHNFLISLRSFNRYKTSFLINLFGLATGLCCVLLIYLWVTDELSVDKFHEHDDRLYQVMVRGEAPNGMRYSFDSPPGPLAKNLQDEIPELETVVPVHQWRGNEGHITFDNKKIRADAHFTYGSFFEIFSFPLLLGKKEQVLTDTRSVVISDEVARKLFSSPDSAIGKAVYYEKRVFETDFSGNYIVSGVFKSAPSHSTLKPELLFSYQLIEDKIANALTWENGGPYIFLVLRQGASADGVNSKISGLIQAKNEAIPWQPFLRKYSDSYLYGHYENGVQAGGRITYVHIFSIIALLVLVVACINFMNLATARASRRFKEIGVKKVIGAGRRSLVFQYLGESTFMAFLAIIIAILGTEMLLPSFNLLTNKELVLSYDLTMLSTIFLFTLATGMLAGSYPAFFLSGFKPVQILKGRTSTSWSEIATRKGLVIFQFSISVLLIVAVMIIYKQMTLVQDKHLGFDKSNIIYFAREGEIESHFETFLNELKTLPQIVEASSMRKDLIENTTGTTGIRWENREEGQSVGFKYLSVYYDLIETLGLEMVAGRSFSRAYQNEHDKIIFNEAAINAMGLENPVGKTITLWGEDKIIIGVVKNFHFESLYEPLKPCFLTLSEDDDSFHNAMVRIKAGEEKTAIASIEKIYHKHSQGLGFEYHFLDDAYQRLYKSETQVSILARFFATIAIIISCLGLFGLAAFNAERRTREIGIRKVLGATSSNIVYLLSQDFTRMVVIAIFIALPTGYLIAEYWLSDFAYRIKLEWWIFASAGTAALFIAWLSVGFQTYRAANANPATFLRDE